MEYTQLYGYEGHGSSGAFGIKVMIAGTKLPDLESDSIRAEVYKAAQKIESVVRAAALAADPDAMAEAARERAALIGLFEGPIFVEEIPNGYCSQWCCKHRPWFVVTTSVGRFTIGPRKRVISIDWKDTVGTGTAEKLFASENVTKGEKSIHAWSLNDAARYIDAVMASAQNLRLTPGDELAELNEIDAKHPASDA